MKGRTHAVGVWCGILACALWGSVSPSGAAPAPFLKTNGLEIRNDFGHGDRVPLRGVNLGGWLLMEPWMCPMDTSGLEDDYSVREVLGGRFGETTRDALLAAYQDAWLTASDFDRIAALGMNVVRLPFWYLNLQDDGGTWRTNAFDRLDWAIDQAWQRGIYTIVDLHGAPGGQRADADTTGRKWPTAELWTSDTYQQRTLEIWARVSQHYRGNPAVAGYDLLNEPMDAPSPTAYWDLLDRCYDVVRTHDPDRMIIMEATYGTWNLEMMPDPSSYQWSNVAYQLHIYPWDDWNDVETLKQVADGAVQDWQEHQAWQVPCHIGEFNMGPEAGWKYAIETYSENGLDWQMWAYKSTFTGGETSWGVYNPDGRVSAIPNIRTDSAAEIYNQWRQWRTEDGFALNPAHLRTLSMPVVNDDRYLADAGPTLQVAAPGVLGNDSHMNLGGTNIQLCAHKVTDPVEGAVTLHEDGSFLYIAPPGFSGVDTFRYQVWDGRIDSARNATVSIVVESNGVGPVSQLLWHVQPGGGTNGAVLAQQPVLATADAYGNLSTNGLPETLEVSVELSSGDGVLAGTTTHNLGTLGSQGMVQFEDLRIDGAGAHHQLTAVVRTLLTPTNLLQNGDFSEPSSAADPDHWTVWKFGPDDVWANHEVPAKLQPGEAGYWQNGVGVYDGSYQMTLGGNGDNRGAGAFQQVAVSEDRSYRLTADAGAENWWLPTGEIRVIWLAADARVELGRETLRVTDAIHDPDRYDVGVPYQSWSLDLVSPPGAVRAKIEIANPVGTGSVWFDNVIFLDRDGSPVIPGATSAPFAVVEFPKSDAPSNSIARTDVDGVLTIAVAGGGATTPHFLQSTTNLMNPHGWDPVPGSTHIPALPGESWSFSLTNPASPRLFFRSAAAAE